MSVIAIALLATQAHAATAGKPFVEVGFGQSSASELCDGTLFGGSVECDDKDTFLRIGAGIMISPTLSAEVGFMDFGKFTYTEVSRAQLRAFAVEAELQAVTLQLGGYAPINEKLNLFGKLGVAFTQFDIEAGRVDGLFIQEATFDESDVEAIATVGASYNFMPNAGINLQLDYVPNVGSDDTGEEDVFAISAGLKYQF